jgi:xanthosine utilization system XapX-like protein
MKFLYKPLALIAGLVGAKVGHSVFKTLWARIDAGEPPKPTIEEASLGKVVGAAALEAAAVAGAKAATHRATARSFHYLTGVWPGQHSAEEASDS